MIMQCLISINGTHNDVIASFRVIRFDYEILVLMIVILLLSMISLIATILLYSCS
jgi:hypothetical protein